MHRRRFFFHFDLENSPITSRFRAVMACPPRFIFVSFPIYIIRFRNECPRIYTNLRGLQFSYYLHPQISTPWLTGKLKWLTWAVEPTIRPVCPSPLRGPPSPDKSRPRFFASKFDCAALSSKSLPVLTSSCQNNATWQLLAVWILWVRLCLAASLRRSALRFLRSHHYSTAYDLLILLLALLLYIIIPDAPPFYYRLQHSDISFNTSLHSKNSEQDIASCRWLLLNSKGERVALNASIHVFAFAMGIWEIGTALLLDGVNNLTGPLVFWILQGICAISLLAIHDIMHRNNRTSALLCLNNALFIRLSAHGGLHFQGPLSTGPWFIPWFNTGATLLAGFLSATVFTFQSYCL